MITVKLNHIGHAGLKVFVAGRCIYSPPDIAGAVIEMDLCASPDPLAEWRSRPTRDAHRYNLDRTLR